MIDNEGFKISDQAKPHFVISYDKNGNIQSLDRKGHIVPKPFQANSGDFGLMDRLAYQYDSGNKLLSVTDTGTTTTGFKDGNTTGDDYSYDENGNMTVDRNKGIEAVEYNHLNLPTRITIDGNGNDGTIEYVYDATGLKLQKQVSGTDNGNAVNTTTQYAGNHIYENGELQFFNHAEGYVTPNGASGYDYVYQLKDHLGNVRLSFINDPSNSGTPTIIEESDYYPFGLKMRGFNGGGDTSLGNDVAQRWKFGGKEYQEELDLGWYDITARNYDPAIGRWMNLDPLAEQMRRHSPYNYAFDNPVFFIDPDGMMPQGSGNSGPGDDLIKKAKQATNKILYAFTDWVSAMSGQEAPDGISYGSDNTSSNEDSGYNPKIETTNQLSKTIDKNAGDVAIGMTFIAGEALDEGGSEVAQKSALTTLSTGGLSSEVTVPLAAAGTTSSIIGKGMKAAALYSGGYEDAAVDEGVNALKDVAITAAGAKGAGKLTKSKVVTEKDADILGAAYGLFMSIFTTEE